MMDVHPHPQEQGGGGDGGGTGEGEKKGGTLGNTAVKEKDVSASAYGIADAAAAARTAEENEDALDDERRVKKDETKNNEQDNNNNATMMMMVPVHDVNSEEYKAYRACILEHQASYQNAPTQEEREQIINLIMRSFTLVNDNEINDNNNDNNDDNEGRGHHQYTVQSTRDLVARDLAGGGLSAVAAAAPSTDNIDDDEEEEDDAKLSAFQQRQKTLVTDSYDKDVDAMLQRDVVSPSQRDPETGRAIILGGRVKKTEGHAAYMVMIRQSLWQYRLTTESSERRAMMKAIYDKFTFRHKTLDGPYLTEKEAIAKIENSFHNEISRCNRVGWPEPPEGVVVDASSVAAAVPPKRGSNKASNLQQLQGPPAKRRKPLSASANKGLASSLKDEDTTEKEEEIKQLKQSLAGWLRETIGHDAPEQDMLVYADKLYDLGLHSVGMIRQECKAQDLEGFAWMKPFHRQCLRRKLAE